MGATLVLLRHGQSDYNKKNLFTGFIDIGLSDQGRLEAKKAQELLKNYRFDAVFTSALTRAKETAAIVLVGKMPNISLEDKALNERDYGELSGKNKDEARAQFGVEQVHIWRRSFDKRPPGGESLKDTCDRVIPYYEHAIKPLIKEGMTILVAAHGNSLRALVKELEHLSDQEIVKVEIPTGVPIIYHFDDSGQVLNKNFKNLE